MKKSVIVLAVMLLFITLVGCVDYKAYDLPKEDKTTDDAELVNEIAAIEEQLKNDSSSVEAVDAETVEEVVLPALEEKKPSSQPELTTDDKGMQVVTVDENQALRLKVTVSDPDQDNVSYNFTAPLDPRGSWKTNYGDAGQYITSIKATDGKLTTEKKVRIVVNRVNVPPVLEGVKDLRVKEGTVITFAPTVTDPNKDQVKVTISEPLKNRVFKTDHTSAGEYNIIVKVSDGELETEKSFKLVIDDVNVLPEISGLRNLRLKEGETATVKPTVKDLDGDDIVLTIADPIGDDGVWETTYTSHGNYTVAVTASDGKDRVTQRINVSVEDVNMPPQIVDVALDVK